MNSYKIEIRSNDIDIKKINEKIYELKQIINKVNNSNQFLERTRLVTLEDLEELNYIDDIYNLVYLKNDIVLNNYIEKLEYTNYNEDKIKEKYIYIFTVLFENVNKKITSYENRINNVPDLLKKKLTEDNLLKKLYIQKKNLKFCIQILQLYFSLQEYFINEFYLSKNLNNVYLEIYTIGLEIINLKKKKEDELKLIYEEYTNYKNILSILNFYQKKKINLLI